LFGKWEKSQQAKKSSRRLVATRELNHFKQGPNKNLFFATYFAFFYQNFITLPSVLEDKKVEAR
jgi:hypothetical protein